MESPLISTLCSAMITDANTDIKVDLSDAVSEHIVRTKLRSTSLILKTGEILSCSLPAESLRAHTCHVAVVEE